MSNNKEIWVLGIKHPDANKSFTWNENIPNISDADIVIIDLNTITKNILEKQQEKIEDIGSELGNKFLADGTIIFIISNNDVVNSDGKNPISYISPISVDLMSVGNARRISYSKEHPFADYLDNVKEFDYYIESVSESPMTQNSTSLQHIHSHPKNEIKNNSGRLLGGIYNLNDGTGEQISGITILLPPTSISQQDAISMIISHFNNDFTKPPSWTERVNVTGLSAINKQIIQLESKKQNIESSLEKQTNTKQSLLKYLKLLYAQGDQLEQIVKDAFILLGFNEIKKPDNSNEEDWLIDLNSIKDCKFGVLEVKGRNKKTTQADLVQCNKWIDNYLQKNNPVKTKGIFISNQFRCNAYPNSKNFRTKYEPNELNYAKTRNICIIPSYVLFKTVNKILAGNNPDRESIEKILFETNGVLQDIL